MWNPYGRYNYFTHFPQRILLKFCVIHIPINKMEWKKKLNKIKRIYFGLKTFFLILL